ncbi:hypothetical protein F4827_003093 [Paraburkholderia bannensis]|uniref:Phage tail tape measure protein n=1 Tax=Paraburkholderia bannensis TaxID=765414 RepID=A0A7W9TXJ3_9BURK|nr:MULTISPECIES: hypothetical protein [Paraburkholderia]MBB3258225.1 hypothetical protein [Paraburkholderia sp. WP4_3_2]MBB6103238.1 hypothetical protein [Paraburkholderia bannensis]
MIFDAYKVAVELSIVDKVGPFLSVFSAQLAGAGKNVDALESRLKSLGKLAAAGGILAGAGVGALAMAEKFGAAAAKYETYWARLRQMGLGDAQIADARKWVNANQIIGTSIQERTRLFVEAQGAFRESGMSGAAALDAAKTMTPVLANYVTARALLGKETSEQEELNLNKIVEQMGGLNSSKRAAEIADAVFKAAMSSGGMVDARQLRLFKTYAMTASAGMSDRMIFGGLEPIIGELGGSTAGTGFQTSFNRMNGVMSLAPHLLVQEAIKLGLWDKDKVELTRGGAARFNKGDPLNAHLKDLMASDAPGFAAEMLARYRAAGITSQADIARENQILFNTTGARFWNLVMKQLPVIERSLKAFDQSRGENQTVEDNENSPQMQIRKFHQALHDLSLEIGQSVLPVLTPVVKDFAAFFHELAQYPALIKTLTMGFIGLSSAMTFGGTLMLLRAGFGGLGIAMTVLRAAIPAAASGLGISGLAGALGALVSPLGLVITAIGLLAAAAYAYRPMTQHEIDSYKDQGGARLTPDRPGHATLADLNRIDTVGPLAKHQGMLQATINMDGRKVAQAVTPYMAAPLGSGMYTGGIDNGASLPMPGLK